jgi:hypothetical protein
MDTEFLVILSWERVNFHSARDNDIIQVSDICLPLGATHFFKEQRGKKEAWKKNGGPVAGACPLRERGHEKEQKRAFMRRIRKYYSILIILHLLLYFTSYDIHGIG